MRAHLSRRSVIGGIGAVCSQLLLDNQIASADALGPTTGEPGQPDLCLAAIAPNILRVAVAPSNAWQSEQELGIVEHLGAVSLLRRLHPVVGELVWGKYRIAVDENPLRITVSMPGGTLRQKIQFDTDSTAVRFEIGGAPLFGLGEGLPSYDLRGTKYGMANGEGTAHLGIDGARLPIPWLISADGWGLFVGQPAGYFDLTGETGIFQPTEATSARNVYLVLGETPAEILRGYALLTGFPHLPPLWALGYQQSHRTLASREEIMSVARSFREKKLPCDTLIYLGTGFCPSGWNTGHGSFTFNADVFPDPKAMFDELHDEHFNVVLHVVPPGDFHGTLHDPEPIAHSSGDAARYWKEHLPVEAAGVDGWWPDEGDQLSVYARFQRNQLYWEGPLSVHPDRRPFALHRNGYAGLQRFGWLWSGDTDSSWEALAAQVQNGINSGLCGIPYWGTDTGGFFPTRELTPELYIRWFQFSAFCPLFRSHGRAWKLRLPWGWDTGSPGPLEGSERLGPAWPPEHDLHDEQVEKICRDYLELRYQLLPYLYSFAAQAHESGLPLIRALWLAYPQDRQSLARNDEYLFGDNFLVAPVLSSSTRKRTVYLPAGAWWDFWSGQLVEGGGEISRDVDLKTMPLYVRAGSIVPFAPVTQHASEIINSLLTLRVYPGADGKFSLYEDDGESFAYLRGEFTRIFCAWNERDHSLSLRTDSRGRATKGKKIQIELVGKNAPVPVTLQGQQTDLQL